MKNILIFVGIVAVCYLGQQLMNIPNPAGWDEMAKYMIGLLMVQVSGALIWEFL